MPILWSLKVEMNYIFDKQWTKYKEVDNHIYKIYAIYLQKFKWFPISIYHVEIVGGGSSQRGVIF